MSNGKAPLGRRFLAALLDTTISWLLLVIPLLGAIIGAAYLLFKDGIMYEITKEEEWKNRSVGKRALGLQVSSSASERVDLLDSLKRNLPFAIGTVVMITPVSGWIIGMAITGGFALIEFVLVLLDARGRRLGDRWAGTTVVDDMETQGGSTF